jgi:glycine/D-amino acid oxidase-like deaminating enzyme
MLCTESQPTQRIFSNILSGLSVRRYESFRECPSYAQIVSKNDQDPRIAEWGIHILFKQADNGQVIIGDAHHYADAHNKEDLGFDIEEQINDYILGLAKQIFDLETYQVNRTWTGIYSQAKHEPIIRKTIDGKIHILNAIGGKGMTAGPGYTYSFIQQLFGA